MILSKIVTPAIGAVAAVLAMPQVVKFMPVVAYMQADSPQIEGDAFSVHVTGRKIRECVFLGGTAAGWYRMDGVWREADGFEFVNDPAENSRPRDASLQDFGVWRWSGVEAGSDAVKFTVVHDCEGQLKLTTVGPFDVPTQEGEG